MKRKKTGGRRRSTPNRSTAEVKELADRYAPAALAKLARLATEAESQAVRVVAGREILDRAYGKAPQAITGDANAPTATEICYVVTGVPQTLAEAEYIRRSELYRGRGNLLAGPMDDPTTAPACSDWLMPAKT